MLRARRLDRPPPRSPDAVRSARYRHRRDKGLRIFRLEADRAALITALLASGCLSERDALDHARVERALTAGQRERKRCAT
jgi:hypothetical protein